MNKGVKVDGGEEEREENRGRRGRGEEVGKQWRWVMESRRNKGKRKRVKVSHGE